MRDIGARLCETVHLALHKTITESLTRHAAREGSLLDVGCWDGGNTVAYGKVCHARKLYGVEVCEEQACDAERKSITVARCNLETDRLPWPTASMDIVVCNQVLEHLKNIFAVMDEIARVIKPDGLVVVSVPNLGSLHSRIMLLLGMQPSMIRVFGPHVRSFTHDEFKMFLSAGDVFEIVESVGVGFYPLPANAFANWLGRLWPSASHTPVLVLRRTHEQEGSWESRYLAQSHQTTM
jgi:2-polyprenyl-3-methyl-5-hydroxy-6-metoxy-1,4-benzoquinol methylase